MTQIYPIDYSKPEVIATFSPTMQSMVHSFSVTENYAVFFYYPLIIKSMTCVAAKKFHIMECVEVFKYFEIYLQYKYYRF